jgi:type II secretory pathway component PulF
MNADDLIALNEEIAAMARAGLPLDQGLAALAREMGGGRLRSVTAAIANDLRAGKTLPEALERQAGQVPAFYAGLVTAGVRSGRIGEVLTTLTVYARTLANLRSTIVEALFYPAVVLIFGLGIVFPFLCFFVLPQVESIVKGFNMRLPYLTELTLSFGRHPLEFFVFPVVGIIGTVLVLRFALRTTREGRRTWARLLYATPLFGTLIRSARLAGFADLLAILVDHEIPLPEAFRLAGEASSDPLMATTAQEVSEDLSRGQPLGEVLRGRGLVPEWVSWMTGLGEQRGSLGQTLHQVAEMYRRQVEMRAGLLRSVLPPFLIVVLGGLVVAIFVLSLMLPMIKLLEGLSK